MLLSYLGNAADMFQKCVGNDLDSISVMLWKSLWTLIILRAPHIPPGLLSESRWKKRFHYRCQKRWVFVEIVLKSCVFGASFGVLVSILVPLSSFLANLRLRDALCVILGGFPDERVIQKCTFCATFGANSKIQPHCKNRLWIYFKS